MDANGRFQTNKKILKELKIKYLVNQILESLNNRYSKSLELGEFERMETDELENGDTHYSVKYYIINRRIEGGPPLILPQLLDTFIKYLNSI